MHVTEVTEGIYRLSVNVSNIFFEGIWPIPNGVCMNSYIVRGEKTAIIDGVCGWDGVPENLFKLLDSISVPLESIDYVIINHMEPDHSGWLDDFKKIRSNFRVLTSEKAVPLLDSFFDINVDVSAVKSGETLDLGNGRVLAFEYIPNVHWPETMATFDTKSGTLFSCDAFGSFGEVNEEMYDDQLGEEQFLFYEKETIRYYSNIVATFSKPVEQAVKKCEALPIRIVAPGHGIVWRKNPEKIIKDYRRYSTYSKGPAEEKITVIWGSMYGYTEKAVTPLIEKIKQEGIEVQSYQVPQTHIGEILASAWTSTGIVLAMPTYEYNMFPPLAEILEELGKKRVLNRKAFRLGSFGWSGGARKELEEIMERRKMHWQFLEPVEFKGKASPQDIKLIQMRAAELVNLVRKSVADARSSGSSSPV